jgi:hypothetical protein
MMRSSGQGIRSLVSATFLILYLVLETQKLEEGLLLDSCVELVFPQMHQTALVYVDDELFVLSI